MGNVWTSVHSYWQYPCTDVHTIKGWKTLPNDAFDNLPKLSDCGRHWALRNEMTHYQRGPTDFNELVVSYLQRGTKQKSSREWRNGYIFLAVYSVVQLNVTWKRGQWEAYVYPDILALKQPCCWHSLEEQYTPYSRTGQYHQQKSNVKTV